MILHKTVSGSVSPNRIRRGSQVAQKTLSETPIVLLDDKVCYRVATVLPDYCSGSTRPAGLNVPAYPIWSCGFAGVLPGNCTLIWNSPANVGTTPA